MEFSREIAEIRFGTGLSPRLRGPRDSEDMMRRLNGKDHAAALYKIEPFEAFAARIARVTALWKIRRADRGSDAAARAREQIGVEKRRARKAQQLWLWQALRRRAHTQDGLRERLAFFWGDHFTARGKVSVMKRATAPYIESAIRPHVAGFFAEMLKAVTAQPVMLHYLDQKASVGPESVAGKKTSKGLNENLARELLELHTLGADGPYRQADVTGLAELLTGLSYSQEGVFGFRPDFAQPGAEQLLGKRYGDSQGGVAALADIHAALEDLARHPATARHLARKMAVHFISDRPDPALVAAMERRYLESGGHLGEMTRAMLVHPAAWAPEFVNVKQPIDYIGSALRALAVPNEALGAQDWKAIRRVFAVPLRLMGQSWEEPLGPDGWPEGDADWITPQRLAARVDWAMNAPQGLLSDLPDPRAFLGAALGRNVPEALRFAATAAEDRRTGVGLVLASPAFQRM
ncbi:DUF1800 domain-containing protein [uncultured Lentibacter sp.]|uniref:DUF1800 domain-containing protein n=1 Tax=uncultured Lentibacter sp. TaxID=1659309 RepID=UPI002604C4E1|nr:DUF1800 domain-containing protein [uncultured Lentibacter sp.]